MKRLALALVFTCSMMIAARSVSQGDTAAGDNKPELKRIMTTMPEGKGSLRLSAISIDRDWSPPITHLKGNVQVEIWSTPRKNNTVTVLRADEADYYENTGEIVPRGNVRVTVGVLK